MFKKPNNRRKALIGISGGLIGASQLPSTWTKPIVDSVILPVHAETTDDSDNLPPVEVLPTRFSGSFNLIPTTGDSTSIENALSLLVSDAFAGLIPIDGQMCIDTSSSPAFSAKVAMGDNTTTLYYEGNGTIGGGPALLTQSPCNMYQSVSITIEVTTVSAAGAVYALMPSTGYVPIQGTLPEGTQCPAEPECPG